MPHKRCKKIVRMVGAIPKARVLTSSTQPQSSKLSLKSVFSLYDTCFHHLYRVRILLLSRISYEIPFTGPGKGRHHNLYDALHMSLASCMTRYESLKNVNDGSAGLLWPILQILSIHWSSAWAFAESDLSREQSIFGIRVQSKLQGIIQFG